MKSRAPFVVMRLSPPRGFFGGRLAPHVECRAYTLANALHLATLARNDARDAPAWRGWRRRASFWIEAGSTPAWKATH